MVSYQTEIVTNTKGINVKSLNQLHRNKFTTWLSKLQTEIIYKKNKNFINSVKNMNIKTIWARDSKIGRDH